MPSCSSCGAQVRWVRTENGKSMPIDPAPRADGNLIMDHVEERVVRGERRSVWVVSYIPRDDPSPKQRFVSHFATCPDRAQHRKST